MDTPDPGSMKPQRRSLVEIAWQRYVEDGLAPVAVRDEIAQSWQRSRRSFRIDPSIQQPTRRLSPDALAARRARDEVLELAGPVLRDFSDRLDLSHQVLTYFDRDGWMLCIDGDRSVIERLEQIGFLPGTSWTEESAGTNGPGTALLAGKPLEVFASEHYVAAWHPWTCAAAPVQAPHVTAPVGLVDITGPWEEQRRHALVTVKAIARAIEERLHAVIGVRDEVVRFAFRTAKETGAALVAVDAYGRVVAANEAAAQRRLVHGGTLRAGMAESLMDAFRDHSETDFEVAMREGSPVVVVSPLRYEDATIGAILRLGADGPRRPRAGRACAARYEFDGILGDAPPFRRALDLARTASRNDLPVVLTGESGTGKELFAQAIHRASARQAGPFVAVNCGSIPAQLIEAELFGYEAGAFTGARKEGTAGRFEDAASGTLFLDEVGELPPHAQTALLRLLQEKEVVRIGSSTPRPVDVRVIAATNKRLDEEIRAGRFRRDLYYRLNVLSIGLPLLRDRGDDVLVLARVFLAQAEVEVGRDGLVLTNDAIAALLAYAWPGNVRELRNVLLRASATAPAPQIRAEDLILEDGLGAPTARVESASGGTLRQVTTEAERSALLSTLEACSWNFARAAQQLGISRMTLYRRLEKCGISRASAR